MRPRLVGLFETEALVEKCAPLSTLRRGVSQIQKSSLYIHIYSLREICVSTRDTRHRNMPRVVSNPLLNTTVYSIEDT